MAPNQRDSKHPRGQSKLPNGLEFSGAATDYNLADHSPGIRYNDGLGFAA
jgi:hypothetical protein